jgi:hypothetical protein
MSNLVEIRQDLELEDVSRRASISEDFSSKIGASINFINRRQFDTIDFKISGPYNLVATLPNVQVDGLVTFPFAFEVYEAIIYTNNVAATGGTTELDLKWKPESSGSYASIFSTTPKFTNAAAVGAICRSLGSAVTGFTKPVLSKTLFDAYDLIRLDILQTVTGPQQGCGLKLFWRPR